MISMALISNAVGGCKNWSRYELHFREVFVASDVSRFARYIHFWEHVDGGLKEQMPVRVSHPDS
jgi:hypothetical protein